MTIQEKITSVDLDERFCELQTEKAEAELALEAASRRALFGEISDAELQPFQAKVAAIDAKLKGLEAAKADAAGLEKANEKQRQRQARRQAAAKISGQVPALEKELRGLLSDFASAAGHAREYDRIGAEIRRIAQPFGLSRIITGLGDENRLVYQELSSSHLRKWDFESIPEFDAAVRARAIGDAPDRTVTLEGAVSAGIERIEQMLSELTGEEE